MWKQLIVATTFLLVQVYGESTPKLFKKFLAASNCKSESNHCFGFKINGDNKKDCFKANDCHYAFGIFDNGSHYNIHDYHTYEQPLKKGIQTPIISYATMAKFGNCNATKCVCNANKDKNSTTPAFIGIVYFDYRHCHNESSPLTASFGTSRNLKSNPNLSCDRDIDPENEGWAFGNGYYRFGKDNRTIATIVGTSSAGYYLKNGTRIGINWNQVLHEVQPIREGGFLYTNYAKSKKCFA